MLFMTCNRRAVYKSVQLTKKIFTLVGSLVCLILVITACGPESPVQNSQTDKTTVATTGPTVSELPSTLALMPAPELGIVVDEKLMVLDIEPGSAAELAGIQKGDTLESIEDMPLTTPEDREKVNTHKNLRSENYMPQLTVLLRSA